MATRLSDKKSALPTDDIDFLDYQISQWLNAIPEPFRVTLKDLRSGNLSGWGNESSLYMNSILFLRANQMRNLLYRPALYSSERCSINRRYACKAIDIAREAVQVLHELHTRTSIVATHSMFFKYFLVSALSVFVLAVSKNSRLKDSSLGVDGTLQLQEFFMALDLFKQLGTHSAPMQQLWNSVRGLEAWAIQMGLPNRWEEGNGSYQQPPAPPAEMVKTKTMNLLPPTDTSWLDSLAVQNDPQMGSVGMVNHQLTNELWSLMEGDPTFPFLTLPDPSFDPFVMDMGEGVSI